MKSTILFLIWSILIGTSINAQDIDSQIEEVKFAMIDGNYDEGLRKCKGLMELNLTDTLQLALIYGYAGLSSEALGHKSDAMNYYTYAVKYQMPQLDVYDRLINLSKKEKNDSIYELALLEKLKAFPEYNQEISKSLAYLYVKTKEYNKLLKTSDVLLGWFSDDYNYLYFKGIALQNLNQTEEAKKYFNETLKVNPEDPGANMSLGLIIYNDGSEIFLSEKKEYEAKAKPDRVDYREYEKGIEKGKYLYQKALPYLLKAYASGSYPGLKPVLFNAYIRLEQKDKAEAYR